MRNLKLLMFLIGVLIAIFAITTIFNDSDNLQNEEKIISTDNTTSNDSVLEMDADKDSLKGIEISKKQLKSNNEDKINLINVITLNKTTRHQTGPSVSLEDINFLIDSGDSLAAKEKINEIINNPKDNFLKFNKLSTLCLDTITLLESFPSSTPSLDELFIGQPLKKALWDTGFCSTFGTDADPFYTYLDLARQGDKVAQLTLKNILFSAINRGIINPRLNPIKYNELRYEAIGYLQNLSTQGVALASLELSREYYTNDTMLLPEDKVLYYFYSFLYEKQARGIVREYPWDCTQVYCKSPGELYQTLTEKEKARADRLIQRAGY